MAKAKKPLFKGCVIKDGEKNRASLSQFMEQVSVGLESGVSKVGDKLEITMKTSRKGKVKEVTYLELERTR